MENKWSTNRETRREIKYLNKQKAELTRILKEINEEESKFLPEERINEIIAGRAGRLEKARDLTNNLREDSFKRLKSNTIKGLTITLNILVILVPYALAGGISYGVMDACSAAPYHQNTHKTYEVVSTYKNNLGESYTMDLEQIEKYGEDSMTVYSPWEKTDNGYSRNVFKTDSCKEDDFDNIEKVNPLDIITDYSFDEPETEEIQTLPEGENNFVIEATRTYKDKENPIVKENTKGQIVGFSVLHFGLTALVGSAVCTGIRSALKNKGHKYILDNKVEDANETLKHLKTSVEKKKIKEKIKELKKKK